MINYLLICFIVLTNSCFAEMSFSNCSVVAENTSQTSDIIYNQFKKYAVHCQGVDTDGTNIYWSQTNKLCKTDYTGTAVVADEDTDYHTSAPTYYNGKVYTAYWAQDEIGEYAEYHCKIQVRDSSDLSFIEEASFTVDQGWGAIYAFKGKLYVGGGRAITQTHAGKVWIINIESLEIETTVTIPDSSLYLGIQTIIKYGKYWMLGYYDTVSTSKTLLVDNNWNIVAVLDISGGEGLIILNGYLYRVETNVYLQSYLVKINEKEINNFPQFSTRIGFKNK